MSTSRGFAFAFVFAALALILFPQPVLAQASVTTTADVCNGQGAAGTTPSDTAFRQAADAIAQQEVQNLQKVWSNIPKIDAASAQCTDNLINSFNSFVTGIQAISDPLGIVSSILSSQISNLLNQACSQVMGSVNGVANSLTSLTRICLPMPNFNLNLSFGLNLQGCSGGTQIPMLTGSGPWSPPVPGSSFYIQ